MKNILYILILISVYSCDKKNYSVPGKKVNNLNGGEKINLNQQVQEIGNLYLPEEMTFKEKSIKSNSEKEDYQITLINSDLLDTDFDNIEKHAGKIASLYYKYLLSNIKPLSLKNIIVKIKHRNLKIDRFEYSKENVIKLSSSK